METVRSLITELGFKTSGEDQVKKYENTFRGLQSMVIKIAGAIGLFELGKHMITSAAGAEQMRVTFEAFTGSAEKARGLMEDIAKYSMATGISKDMLNESAKKMLAMGISSKQIMENIKIVGDLSAGLGKEKIPILTMALSRMSQKGIVDQRVFMQLMSAGVPIMEQLRIQTGLTTKQIMEMGNAGALKYADMQKALLALTTGHGKFANLAMKQATTLNGIWNRGKVILNEYAERMGTTLLPAIEEVGNGILNALVGNMDKAVGTISKVVNFILFWLGYLFETLNRTGIMKTLGNLFRDVGEALADFFNLLASSGAITTAIDILGRLLKIINGLVLVLDALFKLLEGNPKGAWKALSEGVQTMFDAMKEEQGNAGKNSWNDISSPEEQAALAKKGIVYHYNPNSTANGEPGNTFNTTVNITAPAGSAAANKDLAEQVKKAVTDSHHQTLREIDANTKRKDASLSGATP